MKSTLISLPILAVLLMAFGASDAQSVMLANKIRLLEFLRAQQGQKIISGQQNLTWNQSVDMVGRVYNVTKKYPAIQGFDFLDAVAPKNASYSTNTGSGETRYTSNAQKQVSLAKDWWENAQNTGKHGIVTFCWHWRDPTRKTPGFYSKGNAPVDPGLRIPLDQNGQFDPSVPLGKTMLADMEFIGQELLQLQAAGVPVLWRPLHEAAGDPANNSSAWFWWGQDGAAAYIALYRFMHNYYENTLGLKNLIWVWNGQSTAFYPGDEFVDITAWDTYGDRNNGSQIARFNTLNNLAPSKPVALSEVGPMPDPDRLMQDKANYIFFVVWNDSDSSGADNPNNFWSGETWNSTALKRKVYSSRYVTTLDELPDLTK